MRVCGKTVLSVALVCLFGCPSQAELPDRDLADLRSLDRTLALERDTADAVRRKDTGMLKQLSADARRRYGDSLATASRVDRARQGSKAADVASCQLAGLSLRRVIVGFADGRLKPRIRSDLVDAIPPDLTDLFAAQMQRCELEERREASPRLIGSSCLIDGRRCRDRER